MKKGLFQKLLPHLIAVVIFLVVTAIYCKPALQGEVVNQPDIIGWKGMAQQSFEYKEKFGHFPLWTQSLFSGMPAYTIAMEATRPILTGYFHDLLKLWLPKPLNFFFLGCICFYFLCCVLGIQPWIGIMGALSYAYSTYDPVIVAVGHDTKMQAIGLAPAVIGSLLLILKRQYLWGAALLSIFFSYQVGTQHLQIIYYTGIMVGLLLIAYLITHRKQENIKTSLLSLFIALGAAVLGFMTFAVSMFPVREYAAQTMRGGQSQLTATTNNTNKTKGGLDKDYAFNWSYGISETLTFIVPGIYGGSNGGQEHEGTTEFTQKISEAGVPEEQALQMANSYSYWGDQPNTSGPVYLGAVICFLFILGMVYLKSWHKWWIIPATIFGIILAWGKNFAAVNYFLFDYLPLYNKFRAPSMAMVIPQLTFPLTAVLTLHQFLDEKEKREGLWKKFKMATYITGGLFLLLLLLYFSFNYKGVNDDQIRDNFTNALLSQASGGGQPNPQVQQQAQAFGQSMIRALQEDRNALFRGDLFRSLLFIVITALLLAAYIKNKLKPIAVMIGILVLSAIDLLGVGRRYLNDETFIDPADFEASFIPTAADQQILADPAKPFRVFDQTADPFSSSRASYFHNSIGGYHPAKLSLYQDLIEQQLSKGNMEVYNMLNTKYFIISDPQTGQAAAQQNPNAFGPVWLVKTVRVVANPQEEMNALNSTSLKDTAVIQQSSNNYLKGKIVFDSSGTIRVSEYLNDKITYAFSSQTDQFAVFSEIYYPLGWNAFIDGKKTDYVKANYALRGMLIPAGQHTIEFRFEPQSFKTGDTIGFIAGLIAVLLFAAALLFEVRKRRQTGAS